MDIPAKARDLASRFWWLRGAAAALTLSALVPNFIELSRYKYLLGIHLVISAWNEVAARLGRLIGRLLFLPPIPSDVINTIIFVSSITLPSCFLIIKLGLDSNAHHGFRTDRFTSFDKMVLPVLPFLTAFIVLCAATWAYHSLITYDFSAKVTDRYYYDMLKVPGIVDSTGNPAEFKILRKEIVTTSRSPIGFVFGVFAVVILFLFSLYYFRSVRRGFIFVVTFFLFSELLYIVSSPELSDVICDIARSELDKVPKQCRERKE